MKPYLVGLALSSLLAASVACGTGAQGPSHASAGSGGGGASANAGASDGAMFITGVYARRQGSCSPQPSVNSPIQASGAMDRSLTEQYAAAVLIGVGAGSGRVVMRGAAIRLQNLDGSPIEEFSTTVAGFVDAADGVDPSLAIAHVSLIPVSVAPTLPLGTVVASMRVLGETLGGRALESSELLYPIEICEGCLVSYPSWARDLTVDSKEFVCQKTDDTQPAADASQPCEMGVDQPIWCNACSGTLPICQSPANNPYYAQP